MGQNDFTAVLLLVGTDNPNRSSRVEVSLEVFSRCNVKGIPRLEDRPLVVRKKGVMGLDAPIGQLHQVFEHRFPGALKHNHGLAPGL